MLINRKYLKRSVEVLKYIISIISFILIIISALNDYQKFSESTITNMHGANCFAVGQSNTVQGELWGYNPNDKDKCIGKENTVEGCIQLLSGFALNRNNELAAGSVFTTVAGFNTYSSNIMTSNATFIMFDGNENPPFFSNFMDAILLFFITKFIVASVGSILSIYWQFQADKDELIAEIKESSKIARVWMLLLPILIPGCVFVTSYILSWMINFETYYYGDVQKLSSQETGNFCEQNTWSGSPSTFNATFLNHINTANGIMKPIEVSISWSEGGMIIIFLLGTTCGLLFVGFGYLGLIKLTRNIQNSIESSSGVNCLLLTGLLSAFIAFCSPLICFFIFVLGSLDSLPTFDLTGFVTLNIQNIFQFKDLNTNAMANIVTTEFFCNFILTIFKWFVLNIIDRGNSYSQT